MKGPRLYLITIRECIGQIETFTSGGIAEFMRDGKTRHAVLYCLDKLSRASTHLPADWKRRYPVKSWRVVEGVRQIVSPAYFVSNGLSRGALSMIWVFVAKELPKVKLFVDELLAEGEPQ